MLKIKDIIFCCSYEILMQIDIKYEIKNKEIFHVNYIGESNKVRRLSFETIDKK